MELSFQVNHIFDRRGKEGVRRDHTPQSSWQERWFHLEGTMLSWSEKEADARGTKGKAVWHPARRCKRSSSQQAIGTCNHIGWCYWAM